MRRVAALAILVGTCQGAQPHVYGSASGGRPPIINPSWSVPQWVVDIANVSTCASDNNNCTQTTCTPGGGGPCATPEEIYARWGGDNPRLFQATTWIEMSSSTNNQHPRHFKPSCERGGYLLVQGQLGANQLVGNQSIVSPVANRSRVGTANIFPGGIAFIQQNNPGIFTALGLLYVNNTHPARSWTALNRTSNARSAITMPLVPVSIPTAATNLAENDLGGWAVSDSASAYTPTAVDVADVEPENFDATNGQPCVFLNQFKIYDPAGAGVDVVRWGSAVIGYEIATDRIIQMTDTVGEGVEVGCVNCYNNGGIVGGRLSTGHYFRVNAGVITSTALVNVAGPGVVLDGDVMVAGNETFGQGVALGELYIHTSATLTLGGNSYLAEITNGYSTMSTYGPGTINGIGNGRLGFDLSVNTTAVATFINGGGITANGQTTACSVGTGASAATNCGITLNPTNLDAANGASGFGENALGQLGFRYTNNLQ